MQPSDSTTILSEPALAIRYGKTVRTLQRWRAEGYGPAYLRIGGSIFYRVEDVETFEARGGCENLNSGDKWFFCATAA